MMKSIFLLLFFIVLNNIVLGQKSIDKLREEVTSFNYRNQYDSAQMRVLEYLSKKNLTPLEIFYGHFLDADILKISNEPLDAISKLKDCKKYIAKFPNPKKYESLILGNIAECYFNMSNYTEANKYSLASLEASPDSSLRGGGHAVNYLILGYGFYVDKKYSIALDYYRKVLSLYISTNSTCELPLVYMKMAKVYNAMGSERLAESSIYKAVSISDSCGIDGYKLLSKRTMFDIYKDNYNYPKALAQLEGINNLVEKIENKRQADLMSEVQVRYRTLLFQNENKNLIKINQANLKLFDQQKNKLYILISAGIALCILLFIVIKLARQRKLAKIQLEVLNAELEAKVNERTLELAKDISARKKLEKQLSEKVNEMEILITKLSHDMRSPLSAVLGLINLAQLKADKENQDYFDKIKIAIKRLDNIIIDLTSIVYISTMEQKPEIVELDKMINEIIAIMQLRENTDKVKFTRNIKQTKDFYSDQKFIQSIIQNLIENAVKYGNTVDPVVNILIQEELNGIKIHVEDNGIGIADEYHEKIFEMFFRATEMSKGSGLGLYILKKAVEKLHGKIELQSKKGVGTTFTIFLPDLVQFDKQ